MMLGALLVACSAKEPAAAGADKASPTEPTSGRIPAACDLVSAAEMTTILGTAVTSERVDVETCQYTAAEGTMPYVELKLEWGGAEAQAIAAGLLNRAEKGMANRFEGVGDSAVSIGPVLYVRRGEDLITMQLVGVADAAATAKAIYALASPRLPAVDPAAAAASASSGAEAAEAIAEAAKLAPGGDAGISGIADFAKALAALSGDASVKNLPVDSRSSDASKVQSSTASGGALGAAEHIPLIEGLTLTGVVANRDGDYEPILEVTAVGPDTYDIVFSADVPGIGARRPIAVTRRVRNDDQRTARTMRDWFGEGDDDEYPGTVPHFSSAMIDDLRGDGTTPFTLIGSNAALFAFGGMRTLTGSVTRIEREPVAVSVLVNGRLRQLPVIHARGLVSDRATASKSVEVWVLDDRVNPIVLRWRDDNSQSRVVKIEYPEAARAADLERTLEKGETAEVYGIYFEFGSATIRPQSTPVLEEIASIMQRHPDWSLDVAGFTDSIGSDAANLDLSRRRTAAVKTELASRFGIAADRLQTAGHGEASPKATNETPEGRAQNRRVEISRRRTS
jgi:outer membrane protein OmpA-like peptidoglycan-associated protein